MPRSTAVRAAQAHPAALTRVFLTILLVGFASVLAAAADYLPIIGPSSTRFQASAPSRPLSLLLPGNRSTNAILAGSTNLKTNEMVLTTPPPLVITNFAVVDPVPPLTANSDPATWTDDMLTSPERIIDPASVETAKQSDIVTPQMLLHFFRRREDDKGQVGVALPMTFTPPVSMDRPSSRATYISQ